MDAAFFNYKTTTDLILRSADGSHDYDVDYINTLMNAQVEEAWTMLRALQLLDKNNFNFVVIETDNLYVATLLLEVSIEPYLANP